MKVVSALTVSVCATLSLLAEASSSIGATIVSSFTLNDYASGIAPQPGGGWILGGPFRVNTTPEQSIHRGLALTAPDGSLVDLYSASANNDVYSLTSQPDGKTVAAGRFTSVRGGSGVDLVVFPANRLARFQPDGRVDTGFTASTDGLIYAMLAQPDGKILVGGDFLELSGEVSYRLGRLNVDGTFDASFAASADAAFFCAVKTLALQSDGKIVVGGVFDSVGQIARQNIARLNADGTTDSNFNAQANGIVHSVMVQPNGKIVLAGRFTLVNGQVRNHIARLNADGTLDAAFDPNADGYVYAVALQANGGLFVGGSFGSIGGGARANLARLNPDGTLDTTYTPEAEHTVKALGLGQDGTLMVAGDFFTTPTSYSVLLLGNPTAATEGFQIDSSGTSATWARGGSSPEIVAATLESSVNGVQWASHGTGARVAEGWRWNANLQGKAYLRARGLQGYAGGWEGSGSGYFEVKILPGPTTFGEWKEAVLNNVGATETGDENNDGVPNLMEYALVLDPTRNNASPLTISVVADAMGSKHLCLGFRCDAHRSDVSIEVQAANNPSGPWEMIARSDNGGPFSGPGEVRVSNVIGSQSRLEVLDYLEVSSASTRFMRIQISH